MTMTASQLPIRSPHEGYFVPGPPCYDNIPTPRDGTPVLRPAIPSNEIAPVAPTIAEIVQRIPDRPGVVSDDPTVAIRPGNSPASVRDVVPWVAHTPERVAGLPAQRLGDVAMRPLAPCPPTASFLGRGLSLLKKREALRERQEAAENEARIARLRRELTGHVYETTDRALKNAEAALDNLKANVDPNLPILQETVKVAVGNAERYTPTSRAVGVAAVHTAYPGEDRAFAGIEQGIANGNATTSNLEGLTQRLAEWGYGPMPITYQTPQVARPSETASAPQPDTQENHAVVPAHTKSPAAALGLLNVMPAERPDGQRKAATLQTVLIDGAPIPSDMLKYREVRDHALQLVTHTNNLAAVDPTDIAERELLATHIASAQRAVRLAVNSVQADPTKFHLYNSDDDAKAIVNEAMRDASREQPLGADTTTEGVAHLLLGLRRWGAEGSAPKPAGS